MLIEGYASCRIIVLNLLIYKQVKFFQCFQDLRHVRRPTTRLSEASKDNLETGSTSNTLASSKHLSSSNNVDKDDDDDDDDDDVTEDESQHDDDR